MDRTIITAEPKLGVAALSPTLLYIVYTIVCIVFLYSIDFSCNSVSLFAKLESERALHKNSNVSGLF